MESKNYTQLALTVLAVVGVTTGLLVLGMWLRERWGNKLSPQEPVVAAPIGRLMALPENSVLPIPRTATNSPSPYDRRSSFDSYTLSSSDPVKILDAARDKRDREVIIGTTAPILVYDKTNPANGLTIDPNVASPFKFSAISPNQIIMAQRTGSTAVVTVVSRYVG